MRPLVSLMGELLVEVRMVVGSIPTQGTIFFWLSASCVLFVRKEEGEEW